MYVNIRTHCDGNNVERSVNRGFIGESTFPQGGRRSRGVYARSSIPVRARFRTFTCTRWLRSLPRIVVEHFTTDLHRPCSRIDKSELWVNCACIRTKVIYLSLVYHLIYLVLLFCYVMEFVVWGWQRYFFFRELSIIIMFFFRIFARC